MIVPILPAVDSTAFLALTRPALGDMGVRGVVGVALGAVDLHSSEKATLQIFSGGHCLKMVEPNTARDSAEMVKLHALGDRPEGEAVSHYYTSPVIEVAVPFGILSPSPEPAGIGLVDVRPEASDTLGVSKFHDHDCIRDMGI